MRFFGSSILQTFVVVLIICKVDADFIFANNDGTYDQDRWTNSVACGSHNQSCECWETGPVVNGEPPQTTYFTLPAGLCNYEAQLDFYYNWLGFNWEVYHHEGDGTAIGWCHTYGELVWSCPNSGTWDVSFWCTSFICD